MSLNIMQQALVNAGLLDYARAERVNTIEKENKRKQEKLLKKASETSNMAQRVFSDKRKPNQNRK